MHRKANKLAAKLAAQREIQNFHRTIATAALLLVLLFTFHLAGQSAFINNVFIAPASAGGANGTSCTSPFAATYFNTSGNWTGSPPTGSLIGPGTGVHLCPGTYTFAGTSSGLVFQGSGTSGNLITLIADQGAVTITAPAWHSNTGGIDTGAHSYNAVLGQNNLTVQASANGSALANQIDGGNGILSKGGTGDVFKNLLIQNIYVHVQCVSPYTGCDEGAQSTGGISGWGTGLDIENVTCHDAKICFGLNTPGSVTFSGYIFLNNEGYNNDHGLELGAGGDNATVNGATITGNHMHDFINWDDNPAVNNNHHDGFHNFTGDHANDLFTNFVYSFNRVDGNFGAGFNAAYFNEGLTTQTGFVWISNIANDQSTLGHLGCGNFCLEVNSPLLYNNDSLYANPAVASGTAFNFYGTNVTMLGSIVVGAHEAVAIESGASVLQIDYDSYYNIGGSGWNQGSFAGWQSGGKDTHGQNGNNPNLNATTYIPATGSPVIAFSTNLTATSCGTYPTLCSSFNGQARPATGNWDGGAAQHVPGTSPPAAPASLTAAVTGGNNVALQWSAATGTPPITYTASRGTSSGGPYTPIPGASGLTGTTFTDTGLAGGTYYYVVTAQNAGGSSGNSPQASATIVTPTPAISLSISHLTFPSTIIGNTASSGCIGVSACSVTVTNTGTAALVFQSTAITIGGNNAPDFGFGGACTNNLSLAPNATCVATATFAPSQNGAEGPATLNFQTNDPVTPIATVTMTGTGVQPVQLTVTPTALNFGLQYPSGQTYNLVNGQVAQVVVANNSGVSVTITTISYTGTNPGNFGETDNCIGALANGSTCTVDPTFTPSKTPPNKSYSAVLNITYTGAGGGTLTVNVNGTASKHHILSAGDRVWREFDLTGGPAITLPAKSRRRAYIKRTDGYADGVLLTVVREITRPRYPIEVVCPQCFVLRPVENLQRI